MFGSNSMEKKPVREIRVTKEVSSGNLKGKDHYRDLDVEECYYHESQRSGM
jgi:hypothetical protein